MCCDSSEWLIFDEHTRKSCPRHATPADHELVEALDKLAPSVGLKRMAGPERWGRRFAFPYGPNIDADMRLRLLAWAVPLHLRLSRVQHACVESVLEGRCRPSKCGRWRDGLARDGLDGWIDHVTLWTRDGRPAVLLAQPYHLSGRDLDLLQGLDVANPSLAVEVRGSHWYGLGAYGVEIWNAHARPALRAPEWTEPAA